MPGKNLQNGSNPNLQLSSHDGKLSPSKVITEMNLSNAIAAQLNNPKIQVNSEDDDARDRKGSRSKNASATSSPSASFRGTVSF